jgi:putative mRNA 3-end processing factor
VADCYIDPWKPVKNAFITHAHADHARLGHQTYICQQDSKPILKHRLGNITVRGVGYGKQISKNGVKFSFHPAGHIVGSAQVRVEFKGEIWVVSGDYKLEDDPYTPSFEPVSCHTFITECTFGLPVYHWTDTKLVFDEVNGWWQSNAKENMTSLLIAYSLGKAQRILYHLDPDIGQIYTHGAISNLNEVLTRNGMKLPNSYHLSPDIKRESLKGSMILAPPSAVGTSWSHKFKSLSVGMASGWMALRGTKRRRNVDRGFILSDHADWNGLNKAVKETGAENIITTHGYTGNFTSWLNENGYHAVEESTLFEGESIDNDSNAAINSE